MHAKYEVSISYGLKVMAKSDIGKQVLNIYPYKDRTRLALDCAI